VNQTVQLQATHSGCSDASLDVSSSSPLASHLTDLITKTELMQEIRDFGLKISDRTLGFYGAEGLIPPSLRVGARGAAYPVITIHILVWVIESRERGISLPAIKELLPVWLYLNEACRCGTVDIAELEQVARRSVTTKEANYAIPSLVNEMMSGLCHTCRDRVQWLMKDRSVIDHTATEPVTLKFLLGDVDESTGLGRVLAWTQLQLPIHGQAPSVDDRSTIVLGVPLGTNFTESSCSRPRLVKAPQSKSKRAQNALFATAAATAAAGVALSLFGEGG
jgi:DNA-binding transcriptional MerR regulator